MRLVTAEEMHLVAGGGGEETIDVIGRRPVYAPPRGIGHNGGGGVGGVGSWTRSAWDALTGLFKSKGNPQHITLPAAEVAPAIKSCMESGGKNFTYRGVEAGATIMGSVGASGSGAMYTFSCSR